MIIARSMKRMSFLFLLLLATVAHAILPENVGSTQYGTGWIAASDKYDKRVKAYGLKMGWNEQQTNKLYGQLEKILLSNANEEMAIMKASQFTSAERKMFFEMVVHLQEGDRVKKPKLFMIGTQRAVATDGHHRLRTMIKLKKSLEASKDIWPEELTSVMKDLNRVTPDGKLITSLELHEPIVLKKLPKDVKSHQLMREILEQKLGLWLDPADDALATKYYGKKAQNASKKELQYLASKLGIVDSADGIKYIPIDELPDSSMRTLMGRFFDTRGFKAGKVGFKDYVEFYVGDDVKKAVGKNPLRYPNLVKIANPATTLAEQRQVLNGAMLELERLIAVEPKIVDKILSLTNLGEKEVKWRMEKLKFSYCQSNMIASKKCTEYIASLSKKETKAMIKATGSTPVAPIKGLKCIESNEKIVKALTGLLGGK